MNSLAGTGHLIRLALRRDRWRLPIWIILLAGFSVIIAASFPDIYQNAEDRQVRAELIANPAAKAFAGPGYGLENYTFGAMMTNEMLGFMLIFVALMAVLLTIRHTRAEEEDGSAELIQAGAVGRLAPSTAALVVVGGASLFLGLLTTIGLAGLGLDSINWTGSWLYGATYAMIGLLFTAIALFCAQITEHSRAAAGIAGAIIGISYALRGLGDIANSWVSWLSPLGLAQRSAPYVFNRWWVLLFGIALTAVVVAVAYVISYRRDLAAGFLKTKPGRGVAKHSLTSVYGIARHLQRTSFMWWAIGLGLFALLYGTLVGEVEQFVENASFVENIFITIQSSTLINAFLATIVSIFAISCAVYAILAANKLRSEEVAGRAEPILTTATSRWSWALSHLGIALIGSLMLLAVSSLALGIGAALSLGDASIILELLGAAISYTPAIWLLAGLAVLLFGVWPRASGITWLVLSYGFVVGILGGLLGLPQWASQLSPFAHVPLLPAEQFQALPLIILGAIALALMIIGLTAFRRRNLAVV